MESKQAAEHLQVIRTLMERTALYRRALAPIMVFNGLLGLAGGGVGRQLGMGEPRHFILLWMGIAAVALAGSFLLVRRQALKAAEPFWSPPARRVAQALVPPFSVAAVASLILAGRFNQPGPEISLVAATAWLWLYGCGLCAAGFFMPRGIKWLGALFIAAGCGLAALLVFNVRPEPGAPHWVMAAGFGGLHLAYGIYLYLTEKRENVA
jgi:hypothetical protein